jgi:hypothetical protein
LFSDPKTPQARLLLNSKANCSFGKNVQQGSRVSLIIYEIIPWGLLGREGITRPCSTLSLSHIYLIKHTETSEFVYPRKVFLSVLRKYVYLCQDAMPQLLEPKKCYEWFWVAWDAIPQPIFKPLQQLLDHGYKP